MFTRELEARCIEQQSHFFLELGVVLCDGKSLLVSEHYLQLPAPTVVRGAGSSSRILVVKVKVRGKSRLQSTLPPPLRVTLNKNYDGLCSNLLCCLVAQPSTSMQNARTTCGDVPFTLWNTNIRAVSTETTCNALFIHFSLKWPYSILAPLCYGSPNNATLCMVSSGPSVHYDSTLQKSKEGTRYSILTAFSTSFIDSTAENAEEMGLSEVVVERYTHSFHITKVESRAVN